MNKKIIDKVINAWKNHLLTGDLEDYQLEIDEKIPIDFVAIALHLDSRTVKAAGREEEYYEGYRDAAVDVLNLLHIEIIQDDHSKVIALYHKEIDDDKQEELKKHIWG